MEFDVVTVVLTYWSRFFNSAKQSISRHIVKLFSEEQEFSVVH